MATLTKGYTFGATESVTNAKLHSLVDSATISGIVDADVAVGAAIAFSKLAEAGIDGSKLTGLNNIVSGAGVIPSANLPASTTLASVYPIGCIYTSTVATNPATVFGFGTWAAFGAGRVLVGVGTSDAVYAAGATGGESTHTLITAEMPAHTHTLTSASAGGTEAKMVNGASTYQTITSSSTGGGGAHNNLQPYIVVYFWNRTA